jgi:hypothetical protein
MPFAHALRVTTCAVPPDPWGIQIMADTTGDIRAGDVLLMSLFVRGSSGIGDGEGKAVAYLQRNSGAFEKIGTAGLDAGPEWRQVVASFASTLTLDSGRHNFTIHAGYAVQTLEIGGVAILNYRNTTRTSPTGAASPTRRGARRPRPASTGFANPASASAWPARTATPSPAPPSTQPCGGAPSFSARP